MSRNAKYVKKQNKKKMTRGNSTKDQRREKEAVNDLIDESKTNAYSWYAKFPQFTRDAGTIPFGLPVGQCLTLPNGDGYYTPGLMRLTFYPTIGYSADLSSPVNRSAIRFYTFLRDVQKAAAKYDAADIMMYLMALDSCYMFYSLIRRIYGVAQLYTPLNRYYPTALLKLMGVDPSVADNLAELRAYINRFALSLASYAVPMDFDITARHMWMCEGLYLDSNTTRAQTYMFVPEGFWKYNNTVATGSELNFVPWMPQGDTTTPAYTLADIKSIGWQLMTAILGDQDTGNISGDLYRAYGDGGVRKLPETPDLYTILPVYDQTVLSQIENCTIMGQFAKGYTPVISQNPSVNNGAILFQPEFGNKPFVNSNNEISYTLNPFAELNGALVNLHWDSPTPEQVIEATRLVVCDTAGKFVNSGKTIKPTVFGSDIIATMSTAQYINGENMFVWSTNNQWIPTKYQTTSDSDDAKTFAADLNNMFVLMSFDWCPQMYLFSASPDTVTTPTTEENMHLNFKQVGADVDNLTYVSAPQIAMMHEASLFSLFDVPQVAQRN